MSAASPAMIGQQSKMSFASFGNSEFNLGGQAAQKPNKYNSFIQAFAPAP